MSILNNIEEFFNPPVITYQYNCSEREALDRITMVFKKKATIFNSVSISGTFYDSNNFEIRVPFTRYSFTSDPPALKCLLESISENIIYIHTQAYPKFYFKVLFWLVIIICIIGIFTSLSMGLWGKLVGFLIALLAAPNFVIFMSNVGIAAVRERYIIYIHKELKKPG